MTRVFIELVEMVPRMQFTAEQMGAYEKVVNLDVAVAELQKTSFRVS